MNTQNDSISIERDWEQTNQVLAQIFEEVREACAPKDKDEAKLKILRERSVAVHNERISINLRRLKAQKSEKSTFLKIFDMARAAGTQEDLDFINTMVGHQNIYRLHGDIEILLGHSISEEQLKKIEWLLNCGKLPVFKKAMSNLNAEKGRDKLIGELQHALSVSV